MTLFLSHSIQKKNPSDIQKMKTGNGQRNTETTIHQYEKKHNRESETKTAKIE
jgi:hypothetical protein